MYATFSFILQRYHEMERPPTLSRDNPPPSPLQSTHPTGGNPHVLCARSRARIPPLPRTPARTRPPRISLTHRSANPRYRMNAKPCQLLLVHPRPQLPDSTRKIHPTQLADHFPASLHNTTVQAKPAPSTLHDRCIVILSDRSASGESRRTCVRTWKRRRLHRNRCNERL